jgi:hypothetical protein
MVGAPMSEHDPAGDRGAPPAPGALIALGRRLAVERERTITAPMDAVWSVLRDYRARERLLGAEFADYVVRAGGVGEGTVIAYRLRIGRHERARTSSRSRSRRPRGRCANAIPTARS